MVKPEQFNLNANTSDTCSSLTILSNDSNTNETPIDLLKSSMFKKFYDINKNLKNNFQIETLDDEDSMSIIESDDSYAVEFLESIRKISVLTSANNGKIEFNQQEKSYCGGLFRVVLLRNKISNCIYIFLVKLMDKTDLRQDELWLWWMNNDENKIESNDQILSINGIYLNDDTQNLRLGLSTLFKIENGKQTTDKTPDTIIDQENNLIKLELLISRNINRKLIKKNLKKPEIVFDKYLKSLSSLSSSSSSLSTLTCSSTSLSSCKNQSSSTSTLGANNHDSAQIESKYKNILLYNLENGSLCVKSISRNKNNFSPTKDKSNRLANIMTYKDMMVLNTEWTQLETIELLNELPTHSTNNDNNVNQIGASSGNGGFGFGITGNKSTGVVVKVITPGGSASKDGRLRVNDQIFQIGDINVRSMSSEQVAAVLRQSAFHGQYVKFLVARPVHNSVNDIDLLNTNEIINLNQDAKNKEIINVNQPNSKNKCFLIKTTSIMDKKVDFKNLISPEMSSEQNESTEQIEALAQQTEIIIPQTIVKNPNDTETLPITRDKISNENENEITQFIEEQINQDLSSIVIEPTKSNNTFENLIDFLNSQLLKYSLLIDSYEQHFYVKNIDKEKFKTLDLLDQLVEINNVNINNVNMTNYYNDLKLSLKFSKNMSLKFKILNQKWFNYLTKEQENNHDYNDFSSYDLEIISSRIDKSKSKNLGISLEGTVDLDDNGVEKFPHHYIRSIMSNGPIENSIDEKFKPGDELLEIDSIKLYAINYLELLDHLRSLGSKVLILVCARKTKKSTLTNKRAKSEGFLNSDLEDKSNESKNHKSESSSNDNLNKNLITAKSTPIIDETKPILKEKNISNTRLQRPSQLFVRSRSLELNGLALWNKKINYISLVKSEKGLGFSLIDYQQDPFNPLSKTMIVIRALVPGGVAHQDGRLMPGQRLVSINDIILDDDLIIVNENHKKSTQSIHNIKSSLSTNSIKACPLDLLRYTVNVLKALPIGQIVRLGVQKPLPYPDAESSNLPTPDRYSPNLTTKKTNARSSYSLPRNRNLNEITTANKKSCKKKIISTSHYDLDCSNNEGILLGERDIIKYEEDEDESSDYSNERADYISDKKVYLSDKDYEKSMKYGIVATSAPAILNQELSNENNNKYSFYSSTSQLKLNTLNMLNQICKSNSKLNSENYLNMDASPIKKNEMQKQDFGDIQLDEEKISTSTPKTQMKSCIKNAYKNSNYFVIDKSISMQFSAFKDELNNENIDLCADNENITNRMTNSVIYLNKLLGNKQNEQKYNFNSENNKQLLNEEQFNQAFIINTNKKLKNLIGTNQTEDYIIDEEIIEIESILSKQNRNKCDDNDILENENNFFNNHGKEYNLIKDDDITKKSKNHKNIRNSHNLKKMVHDMTSFKWPEINDTNAILVNSNSNRVKSEDLILKNSNTKKKSKSKRKGRTFEEQNIYISKSRSPSGARTLRNFPDNTSRYRSISQGNNPNYRLSTKQNVTSTKSTSSRNSSRSNSVKIINILGKEIVKLPTSLEHEIRIKKNFYRLGIMSVDCFADEGINGCVIKKIEPNSACARDNRLKVGDYLLSVNNEQMRILTNSSARAILNRASLTSKDVVIIYIPQDEALKFKSSVMKFDQNSTKVSSAIPSSSSHGCIRSKNIFSSKMSSSSSDSSRSISIESNKSCSFCDSYSSSSSLTSLNKCDKIPGDINMKNRFNEEKPVNENDDQNLKNQKRNHNRTTHCRHCHCIYKKKIKNELDSTSHHRRQKISNDKKSDLILSDYAAQDESIERIDKLTISLASQNDQNSASNMTKSNEFEQTDLSANLWGQTRIIILEREENKSLGISIVGGKLDVCSSSGQNSHINNFISGIFIKHVLENSPAGINGTLKTGDRILAVNDVDLTHATHDRAVDVIRNAKSPVKFSIQSLICVGSTTNHSNDDENRKQEIHQENVIDQSRQVIDESNKYNYSLETIQEKYNYLLESKESSNDLTNDVNLSKAKLYIFRLKRNFPNESLGLSLSGNVNLNKTSVFVCGIYPNSIAQKHGLINIGDQILEINGQCIYGRAHSNVTPLIKNLKDLDVYLVILRSDENLKQMFKPSHQAIMYNYNSISPIHITPSPTEPSVGSVTAPLALSTNITSYRSSICAEIADPMLSSTSVSNQSLDKQRLPSFSSSGSSSCAARKIDLKKGPNGFGIAISEDRYGRLIVRGLNSNGVAFQDGRLQVGDEIIAVNNIRVSSMKYDDVMNLLHTTQEPVEFQVCKPEHLTGAVSNSSIVQSNQASGSNSTSCNVSSAASPQVQRTKKIGFSDLINQSKDAKTPENKINESKRASFDLENEKPRKYPNELGKINERTSQIVDDDPKTNQIRVGEETWIEIERGNIGLGLSIVGGSDTQLPGIIVHDIYQNGAAFKDKRLSIGDQILKVNNVDLISATHDQALNALRQTSDTVKILVHRGFTPNQNSLPKNFNSQVGFDDERFLNILVVDLNKKFGKGLGFSIIGRRDGSGVFISHIIEGGCAHKDGRLTIGDLILEVNGQDIRKSAYNDVAFLLKTLPQGKVILKVGRFKTSASVSNSNSASNSLNGSKAASRRNSNTESSNLDIVKITKTPTTTTTNINNNNSVSTFKPCIKK